MNNAEKFNACDIVNDLLPLYADGVCSEGSRAFIEKHVKECEKCRITLESMRSREEENLLEDEKKTALTLHKKNRDGRTLKSILLAIAAAYIPLLFIAPLFANDTGLTPTNYPFRLLVVVLYSLPFLTALISLGFTALDRVNGIFPERRKDVLSIIALIASLCTLVACFDLSEHLYAALFGTAVNIAVGIITAVMNRKNGRSVPIHKKTFFFCFFAVFTAFLALIIALSVLGNSGNRADPMDEPLTYSYSEPFSENAP